MQMQSRLQFEQLLRMLTKHMWVHHFARVWIEKNMVAFALCYHSEWMDIGLHKKWQRSTHWSEHCAALYGPFIADNFIKTPKQFNRSNWLSYEYFQLIRMICARIEPFWATPRRKKRTDRKFYYFIFIFISISIKRNLNSSVFASYADNKIWTLLWVKLLQFTHTWQIDECVYVSLAISKIGVSLPYRWQSSSKEQWFNHNHSSFFL